MHERLFLNRKTYFATLALFLNPNVSFYTLTLSLKYG